MKYPGLVAALEAITTSAYNQNQPNVTFLAEMERVFWALKPEHIAVLRESVVKHGVWPDQSWWEATDYVEYGVLRGLVNFLLAAQDMPMRA